MYIYTWWCLRPEGFKTTTSTQVLVILVRVAALDEQWNQFGSSADGQFVVAISMRNGIYVSWNVGENRASYLHVVYHMTGGIDRSFSYTSYSRFRLLATSRNVLLGNTRIRGAVGQDLVMLQALMFHDFGYKCHKSADRNPKFARNYVYLSIYLSIHLSIYRFIYLYNSIHAYII